MENQPVSITPVWRTRQVVLATLFIVAVGAAFWLLVRFGVVLFILFIAIVISTAMTPLVERLRKWGVPRAFGVILIYFLLVALLTGFVFLAAPVILDQVATFGSALPGYYGAFHRLMTESGSRIIQLIGFQLPGSLNFLPATPPAAGTESEVIQQQVNQLLNYTGIAARVLFVTVAIFLLIFYWTMEGERSIRSLLLLFPTSKRDEIRDLVTVIQEKVGSYVLGQVILSTIIGGLQLIAYLILGIPYAFLLGVIAGLLEVVPVLGPTLGAVPAILIAISLGDPYKIIGVLISTVLIHLAENTFLGPRVLGKSVGVHPIVTLLALAAFTSLFGLPGAVMAVPLAAVIQLLMDRYLLKPGALEAEVPVGRDAVSALRLEIQELATDVRKQVRTKEDDLDDGVDVVEDEIETLAKELDQLLAALTTQQVLVQQGVAPAQAAGVPATGKLPLPGPQPGAEKRQNGGEK